MSQHDFSMDDVRKLLARKRLEMPSEEYFSGILPEFHRRLEESAARTPWMRFLDAISGVMAPRLAVQYTLPVLAAVGLVGLTLSGLTGAEKLSSGASMLALQLTPEADAPQGFAFDEGVQAATNAPLEIELDATLPHYVLADSASGYDSTLAF